MTSYRFYLSDKFRDLIYIHSASGSTIFLAHLGDNSKTGARAASFHSVVYSRAVHVRACVRGVRQQGSRLIIFRWINIHGAKIISRRQGCGRHVSHLTSPLNSAYMTRLPAPSSPSITAKSSRISKRQSDRRSWHLACPIYVACDCSSIEKETPYRTVIRATRVAARWKEHDRDVKMHRGALVYEL